MSVSLKEVVDQINAENAYDANYCNWVGTYRELTSDQARRLMAVGIWEAVDIADQQSLAHFDSMEGADWKEFVTEEFFTNVFRDFTERLKVLAVAHEKVKPHDRP